MEKQSAYPAAWPRKGAGFPSRVTTLSRLPLSVPRWGLVEAYQEVSCLQPLSCLFYSTFENHWAFYKMPSDFLILLLKHSTWLLFLSFLCIKRNSAFSSNGWLQLDFHLKLPASTLTVLGFSCFCLPCDALWPDFLETLSPSCFFWLTPSYLSRLNSDVLVGGPVAHPELLWC